jgi:DNA repair protein RadC
MMRISSAREDVLTSASRIIAKYDGLRGLAGFDLPTLGAIHGLGPAKASTICHLRAWAPRGTRGRGAAASGDRPRPAMTLPSWRRSLLRAS